MIYRVENRFRPAMLAPIARNLLDKLEHDWDDYDEVAHSLDMICRLSKETGTSTAYHTAEKEGRVEGFLMVTSGERFPLWLFPREFCREGRNLRRSAVLNNFHVAPEARGIGERWLRETVLPRCAADGIERVYVKSSHARAFSLYRRLGREIGCYETQSDHGLQLREGRIFEISLDRQ